MFTGLIEATGRIVDRHTTSGGLRLRIGSALAGELAAGDSLAVNGVCLTVIVADAVAGQVVADVGPETMRVTTLGRLSAEAPVNLERPLRADSRFGGHFVQGHVDAIGRVEARRPEAEFEWLTVSFPERLAPFFVLKGSVAVDGISLTVAGLGSDRFDVQIVPYTLAHTNLRGLIVGDEVNLECDMVGKYVARAAELAGLTGTRHL
ncbi:MAG: riboflavin synthase [Acidobacteriota bacterium]